MPEPVSPEDDGSGRTPIAPRLSGANQLAQTRRRGLGGASDANHTGHRGEHYVALLLAAFSVGAAFYAACIAASLMPFNSGAWIVGEDIALRGWLAYAGSAAVHFAAAAGLWKHLRPARWLAVFLLAAGLIPAVPGVSAAVIDLRVSGIVLWGTLIVLRTSAMYLLLSTG